MLSADINSIVDEMTEQFENQDDIVEYTEYQQANVIDIEDVNLYSAGYKCALEMVEGDRASDEYITCEEYLAMDSGDDDYSRGWNDGIVEMFPKSAGH